MRANCRGWLITDHRESPRCRLLIRGRIFVVLPTWSVGPDELLRGVPPAVKSTTTIPRLQGKQVFHYIHSFTHSTNVG